MRRLDADSAFADTVEKGGAVCADRARELGSFSRRQVAELGEIVRHTERTGWRLIVEEDGARSPIAKFLTATDGAHHAARRQGTPCSSWPASGARADGAGAAPAGAGPPPEPHRPRQV